MSSDRINVVVVGGGVIGCSVAYYLARKGVRVTLLERGSLCSEASSAAAGLAGLSNREGHMLPFAQESLRLMREVATDTGMDFELEQRGSLAPSSGTRTTSRNRGRWSRSSAGRGLRWRSSTDRARWRWSPQSAPISWERPTPPWTAR